MAMVVGVVMSLGPALALTPVAAGRMLRRMNIEERGEGLARLQDRWRDKAKALSLVRYMSVTWRV